MKQPQGIEPMINENIPDDWENDDDDEENEGAVAPPVKHAPTPKAHTVWATKPVNLKSSPQNRALLAGQEHGGSFFDGGELGSMADDYDASRDSRTIWEAAYAPYFLYPALAPRNTRNPNPMPSVVFSPTSTSSRGIVAPPIDAFQPAMRILKRSPNPQSQASVQSSAPAESLQERELRYQTARDRIFGSSSSLEGPDRDVQEEGAPIQGNDNHRAGLSGASSPGSKPPKPKENGLIRQPRGPPPANEQSDTIPASNFERRMNMKPSQSPSQK